MVWKEMVVEDPLWLFGTWPFLMCEWNDFAISEKPLCQKPSSSFCSSEYMVWKKMLVPRWLLSAWPSLMCDWDDLCYF